MSFYAHFIKKIWKQTFCKHRLLSWVNYGYDRKAKITIFEIKECFLALSTSQWSLLSEVCLLLQLILVLPATNATSECSFSALSRVKSSLRNTMGQERLNSLMILHVHKGLTDKLNMKDVANEFVGAAECRLSIHGKFR